MVTFISMLLSQKLMLKKMPNLLKALALIYQHSTFYNTFSHMTVLFVKVSLSSCGLVLIYK